MVLENQITGADDQSTELKNPVMEAEDVTITMKTLIMEADDQTTELKNLITGAVDQTTELKNQIMGLDDQTTGLHALPARPVLGVQCLPHQQPADQRSDHQPPPPPRDQLFNPRRHHHHHPHDLHTSLQRFRRLCFIRYQQRRLLCLTGPLFFQHRQSGIGCSLKLCFLSRFSITT